MRNDEIRYMTTVGMLSAFAYVFTLIGHFIPIYFNDFLKYDPKDAVIVIAGFALGPVASLIISVIVALLELITISTTGVIGFLMNVLSSVSFAVIASCIYKYRKTLSNAVFGLALSSIITVGVMALWNYLVTPYYMGIPREIIAGMIFPVFVPFNVIKCGLNAALVMLLYKPCVQAMRRAGLIASSGTGVKDNSLKYKLTVVAPSLLLIAAMITLFIILG